MTDRSYLPIIKAYSDALSRFALMYDCPMMGYDHEEVQQKLEIIAPARGWRMSHLTMAYLVFKDMIAVKHATMEGLNMLTEVDKLFYPAMCRNQQVKPNELVDVILEGKYDIQYSLLDILDQFIELMDGQEPEYEHEPPSVHNGLGLTDWCIDERSDMPRDNPAIRGNDVKGVISKVSTKDREGAEEWFIGEWKGDENE